ncbi:MULTISPECIES: alpha/beta fold hydrolase [Streptomyces]|uniref:alpha/beta fold hydrolase n=1 Tax=Streptomyces TaxID=1883 RepID=UPI000262EE1A|nr:MULTISPECIES: alpha/beta fold hydrolase [Streptomyces]MYS92366.1 alpha/beta fold hydrolase [Streptomyces sp. SID5464]
MSPEQRTVRETEEIICGVWSRLLDTDVLPTDDFFEIGGDSLLVVEVLLDLRGHGLDLKAAAVFRHPTPAALARYLADANPPEPAAATQAPPDLFLSADDLWSTHRSTWAPDAPRCLFPLVREGDGEPLFIVHWGNDAGFVWSSTSAWGAGRPVYGFEAPGFRGDIRPVTTVADMADRYLVELLEQQPEGPYHLAGHCHGAVVAYELARRLRARGQEVAVLAMVKPSALERFVSYGWGLDEITRYRLESLAAQFSLVGDESLDEVFSRMRKEGWYDDRLGPQDLPRLQVQWSALALALHQYEPRPYDGPVLIVQDVKDREDTERNWLSVLPQAETLWVDHGVDLPRPTLRDPEVVALIREKLTRRAG